MPREGKERGEGVRSGETRNSGSATPSTSIPSPSLPCRGAVPRAGAVQLPRDLVPSVQLRTLTKYSWHRGAFTHRSPEDTGREVRRHFLFQKLMLSDFVPLPLI